MCGALADEVSASFHGLELEPAFADDDGSWFAVIAGPSAEAGADPGGVGERPSWMRVLLPLGFALERGAAGFEQRDVLGVEGIGDGPQRSWSAAAAAAIAAIAIAVAGMH